MSHNPLQSPPQDLTGHIMMASPLLKGGVFDSACILITKHNKEGAEGFILNHHSDTPLGQILNPVGKLSDQHVYFGGPVDTKSVNFLIIGSNKKDELMFRANASIEEAQKAHSSKNARVLPCLGYAGWGAGQIESELEHHTWFFRKAPKELVEKNYNLDMWVHLMSTHSAYHKFIAQAPYNLTLN